MEKIPEMNLSDMYGEMASNIPSYIFKEIRDILSILLDYNIEYIDITGYNFIQWKNKIWIIDFEHCNFAQKKINPFLNKFINGINEWNPEFK